jgi:hypothetical protein
MACMRGFQNKIDLLWFGTFRCFHNPTSLPLIVQETNL